MTATLKAAVASALSYLTPVTRASTTSVPAKPRVAGVPLKAAVSISGLTYSTLSTIVALLVAVKATSLRAVSDVVETE